MKIGGLTLTSVERGVDELDNQLVSLLGISAAEMRAALAPNMMLRHLAVAIAAVVKEEHEIGKITNELKKAADSELHKLVDEVRGIYDRIIINGRNRPAEGDAEGAGTDA